jgi:hypothetical protein
LEGVDSGMSVFEDYSQDYAATQIGFAMDALQDGTPASKVVNMMASSGEYDKDDAIEFVSMAQSIMAYLARGFESVDIKGHRYHG